MSRFMNQKFVAAVVLITLSCTTITGSVFANEKSEILRDEIKIFQVLIDSGAMQPRQAVDTFSKHLIDNEVSFIDLDTYIKERSTRNEYKKFRANFESAMAGVDGKNITATEMSQVSAQLLNTQVAEGLSWSGCAGIGIGAAVLVAAVVVGIVALVKSKGVEKIKSDYQGKMNATSSAYASNRAGMINQPATSQYAIQYNNDRINTNNSRIFTLNNEIWSADPKSPSYASDVQNWSNQINQLNADNQTMNQQNNYLHVHMNDWLNPNFKAAQLAALDAQFNVDEANLQSRESTAIQMVPANQALAKDLGIGAGIGAAVGIYILVDGLAHGDGC